MATTIRNTNIYSVSFLGRGHWKVIVTQIHFKRSNGLYSSQTIWEKITTNSMAIDDYNSEDNTRRQRGYNVLLRETKMFGTRRIEKF
jgi:hypothetical protein